FLMYFLEDKPSNSLYIFIRNNTDSDQSVKESDGDQNSDPREDLKQTGPKVIPSGRGSFSSNNNKIPRGGHRGRYQARRFNNSQAQDHVTSTEESGDQKAVISSTTQHYPGRGYFSSK